MPIQSRNRRQQRRRSIKMRGGEEKDIMDKLDKIEEKINGLNTLIMQGNPAEEVPPVKEVPEEKVDDADDDLKTVTPESNIDDESNNKLETLETPEMPENGSKNGSEMPENGSENGSEMPENGSEMPENGSGTGSEMPKNGSGTGSEIKSEGGRRNSRRRRQRNNRKSQRRQRRR